jgi:hypothetical protein
VNVSGQETLPAGIGKVSINDTADEANVIPEPIAEPMNTEDDNPSSTKAEPANSLIPNFIELSDEQDKAGPKFASSEQASSLAKLERAEKDEKTLEKLRGGVRPGEFFRVFSQLNRVDENKGKGHCADWLTELHDFCDHMKRIDTGLFAVPDQVKNGRK